jgi:hypothetical protein
MKEHNRHGGKESGNCELRYIHDSTASKVNVDHNYNVVLRLLKGHSHVSALMRLGENPLKTPRARGLELG